jgi:ABC-type multidrug transport system permease subunit
MGVESEAQVGMTGLRTDLMMTWALMRRGLNEIVRVPGAAIPGILAPAIFMLGLSAVFGKLTLLPGFGTDDFMTFLIGLSFLQGAGFTGAATGVNLARDIELGWFDRLLASPVPRGVLLAGTVLSASLRALLPITMLLIVGLSFGVHFPGLDGLAIAVLVAAAFSAVTACYAVIVALRFKTQAAAPLMQAGVFMAVLFTTSYAPQELLTGWLKDVARLNPVTQIVETVRQGFVGDVSWSDTWPGLLALVGIALVVTTLALRGLNRAND